VGRVHLVLCGGEISPLRHMLISSSKSTLAPLLFGGAETVGYRNPDLFDKRDQFDFTLILPVAATRDAMRRASLYDCDCDEVTVLLLIFKRVLCNPHRAFGEKQHNLLLRFDKDECRRS